MNRILFNILMTRLWGWREEKKCCAQTTLFIEIHCCPVKVPDDYYKV